MGTVDFFAAVKKTAGQRQSLYTGRIKDRRKLLDFLEMNSWFGLPDLGMTAAGASSSEKLYVTEEQADELCSRLLLWLDGFRRENKEKLEILLCYGENHIPRTVSFYREFVRQKELESDLSAWRLLDFLLYHLPGEAMEITPEKQGELVDTLDREAKVAVKRSHLF